MTELVENKSSIDLTAKMIAKGREPHSVIICGEQGLGKRTLAKYLAAQLLCEKGTGIPCGSCRHCRLIANNAHPDVITAVSSDSGNYKVDDIRMIVSDAYVSPNEARMKVYIIPDIDRSVQTSVQLQNILLKTIEEPPDMTAIILTARSKEIFLETIISRTIHLYAEEVTPAAAMAYLIGKGINKAIAEEAVRRCGGNIGRALQCSQSEEERASAELAVNCCRALAKGSSGEYELLAAVSECDGKKAAFMSLVGYMQRIVRDAVRLRENVGSEYIFSREVCGALGRAYSSRKLVKMYDSLAEHSTRASANCLVSMLQNSLTAALVSI